MPDQHKNLAVTAVATAPSPATTGTSLTVTTGEGALLPTPPFNATVSPDGLPSLPSNAEIIRVTGIAGDVLTIKRQAEAGGINRTIVVGDKVVASVTLKTLTDVESSNEVYASTLIDATAAGDAGSRADHFLGSALGGSWGNMYGVGVAAVVKNSMLSFTNTSGSNVDTGARKAFTPSGAFRLEYRVLRPVATSEDLRIEVTDSLTSASENAIGFGYTVGTGLTLNSRETGVYTNRVTNNLTMLGPFIYLALERSAANVWTASYSWDRAVWTSIGTYTKTLTAAYIKAHRFTKGSGNQGGFDFLDVVS